MNDKSLLLIGLRYHNYTSEIALEFERLGFAVTYHEVQPRNLLYKTVRRILPPIYKRMIERHHRNIIKAERNKTYEYVIFIQAHQFSVENIEELRRQHKTSKFVLYNWDSLSTHDYRPQMHVFDSVFTFDRDDAAALDINYLPLFCIRSFQAMREVSVDKNTIYTVGNIVNPLRYRAVKAFESYCNQNGIKLISHLACTPYTYMRMLRSGILPRGVSLSSIEEKKFLNIVSQSAAVFDFANHKQSGYTMRVMENICMGKKIITNNSNIVAEPFYSPDRVFVYKDLGFSGVKEFLASKPVGEEAKVEEYYVQNFVRKLID